MRRASLWAVPRSDARGQAIAGVVRSAGDPVEIVIVEWDCTHDRTKDLLADDRHIRVGVGQHGRLDEISLIAHSAAAGDDLGALLPPRFEVTRYPLELLVGDERAELGLRIEPVPDADLAGAVGDTLHQLVEHALMR